MSAETCETSAIADNCTECGVGAKGGMSEDITFPVKKAPLGMCWHVLACALFGNIHNNNDSLCCKFLYIIIILVTSFLITAQITYLKEPSKGGKLIYMILYSLTLVPTVPCILGEKTD